MQWQRLDLAILQSQAAYLARLLRICFVCCERKVSFGLVIEMVSASGHKRLQLNDGTEHSSELM